MGTPNKYRANMCAIAEQILANGESKVAIAAALGISRTTLYEWCDLHPEFQEAIECGLPKAQRVWEKIGFDGATGNIEKFNAPSWIFTMKNRFRDDYRDEKEVKNTTNSVIEMLIDKLVE